MEIRELKLTDYELNYFELLSQLSQVIKPSKKEFEYYFNKIISNNNHKIFVIEEDGVIVANVTIILEQKFIRGCKCICHIEDVVVHKEYRGKGIASKLLDFVKYQYTIPVAYDNSGPLECKNAFPKKIRDKYNQFLDIVLPKSKRKLSECGAVELITSNCFTTIWSISIRRCVIFIF